MEPVGYALLNTTNAEVLFKGPVDPNAKPLYLASGKVSKLEKELLYSILDLLEYITFHDGRYSQLESQKAYDKAYSLAKVLCDKLEVKMYENRERTI